MRLCVGRLEVKSASPAKPVMSYVAHQNTELSLRREGGGAQTQTIQQKLPENDWNSESLSAKRL